MFSVFDSILDKEYYNCAEIFIADFIFATPLETSSFMISFN